MSKRPETKATTRFTTITLCGDGRRSYLHVCIEPGKESGNPATINALGYVSGEAKLRKLALAILKELGPAKKRARKAGA